MEFLSGLVLIEIDRMSQLYLTLLKLVLTRISLALVIFKDFLKSLKITRARLVKIHKVNFHRPCSCYFSACEKFLNSCVQFFHENYFRAQNLPCIASLRACAKNFARKFFARAKNFIKFFAMQAKISLLIFACKKLHCNFLQI